MSGFARTRFKDWAGCVLVGASLLSQTTADAAVQIAVRTIDHTRLQGELVNFSLGTGLTLQPRQGDEFVSIPMADLVHIENLSATKVPPGPICLNLIGGDKLYGTIAGSAPDQIVFDTLMRKAVAIPIDRIESLLSSQAEHPTWKGKTRRLIETDAEEDRVLMSNGDLMSGLVVRVDPDQLVFEHQDREVMVSFEVIIALAMNHDPVEAEHEPRAHLRFIDGSMLTVSGVRWSPDGLELTFFDGTMQGLPPETIERIEARGTKWTWLTDLLPDSYRHTPLMGLQWPYKIDRNVTGGILSIAGQKFWHGIGVHSRTSLKYDLNGRFREFTSACGLDDTAGSLADVEASVVVDGHVKWREKSIRAGSAPLKVRVDVSGASHLELRVDYGENADLQDRFNWADAALIRN